LPPTFSRCIDQDTLICTVGENDSWELKKAQDMKIGDIVWSPSWDEMVNETELDPYMWNSESLSNLKLEKTEIKNIIPSIKDITLYINDDLLKRFSLEQTVLVKKNGTYFFGTSGILEVGDVMIARNEDGSFDEVQVSKITLVDEERTVYEFDADPTDLLIAGGLVVHNSKRFA
jgi:hypothetical protein